MVPGSSDTRKFYTPPIGLRDAMEISQVTMIPLHTLLDLDIYSFRILLINCIVNQLYKSEEGRDSLERMWEIYNDPEAQDFTGTYNTY